MIEQLVTTYGNFHDALILNVEHKGNINLSYYIHDHYGIEEVILVISCYNELNDYKKDIVELKFTEIEEFRYIRRDGTVTDTFIEREDDFFVIDFDPIITSGKTGGFITKKNLESTLSIKFKNLFYKIIS
jgi:hypothetical protein